MISRDWHWTLGKTHGVIIETTAGRASLGIYRAPTDGLHLVLIRTDIATVKEVLWKYGKPPEIKKTFTYGGSSITVSFGPATVASRALAHRVIFDHTEDLRSAIKDSYATRECLAVTLISYGVPTINWTKKAVGCKDGAT